MQIAGHGFASPMEAATLEFRRFGKFHDLALRYVQAQLTQATQSAGCNAKHELDQRLARWLLLCSDRARSENFSISHEFLADMLGVSRPTISVAAAHMKEQGLISYTRGIIHIVDPAGLEKMSCECYRVVKDHLDNYLEFDTGFVI
jgi:CRP-like cAMP-binding protein